MIPDGVVVAVTRKVPVQVVFHIPRFELPDHTPTCKETK